MGWARVSGAAQPRAQVFATFAADESPVARFVARLQQHVGLLVETVVTAGGLLPAGATAAAATDHAAAAESSGPQRDMFNSCKRIVAVSRTGKLFGLDSDTGAIAWCGGGASVSAV